MKFEAVKLSDICLSITDGDHQAPPKAECGVPFVTIKNITNNQFDFSETMFVPQSYYDEIDDKRKARQGDILLSVVGSFGIPVFIKEDKPFVFQRHIAILRPNPDKVVPRFLYYFMLSPSFYAACDTLALGSAQRTISLSSLRNLEVSIPISIEEQQRIASYLSVYDDLVENNQNKIKLLEELQERVYRNEFGLFSFNSDKSVDSMRLRDICNYSRGVSYTSKDLTDNGDVSLINLKNIRAYGGYNWGAEKYYAGKVSSEQLVMPGSLIMGVTDMTKERRLIGHVAIVPQSLRNAIISMDLIKLLPKIGNGGWLYSLLRYGKLSFLISSYANGVNVLHLRPDTIMDIEVPIPPREKIEQYESFFWNTERQIEILQSEIDIALEGRNKLLQNIFK